MQRIGHASTAVLRTLIAGQPTTAAKVAFAWQVAAGPALAAAATLAWNANGTLHVIARSDAWRREIVRAKPVVISRMTEILGPGVVKTVTVIADDPTAEKPKH